MSYFYRLPTKYDSLNMRKKYRAATFYRVFEFWNCFLCYCNTVIFYPTYV